MISLVFERRKGVFLPEINAYCDHLRRYYPHVQALDVPEENIGDFKAPDYRWKFLGIDRMPCANQQTRVIHEYGSLSVAPFPRTKNFIKRCINVRPFRRVFLNESVAKGFGFNDNVTTCFRDMGVADGFFIDPLERNKKEYDFVYVGGLYRDGTVIRFLEFFAKTPALGTLLVIGDVKTDDVEHFKQAKHITFTGSMPYTRLPALMQSAHFGLNLTPLTYPFTLQTSTKLLEYAACGLKIISTPTIWAKDFEQKHNASFFWLRRNFSNLSQLDLAAHTLITPNVENYRWRNMIEKSCVMGFLPPNTQPLRGV